MSERWQTPGAGPDDEYSDVAYEPVSPVAVVELVYDDGVELEPAGSR